MRMIAAGLLAVCLGLGACDENRAPNRPPPPEGPQPPPQPELPMSEEKAREIMSGLSLTCTSLANWEFRINQCKRNNGGGEEDLALRERLRTLRSELDRMPRADASARCADLELTLTRQPAPPGCW